MSKDKMPKLLEMQRELDKRVTIDEAIAYLEDAKEELGGDAMLVLSLTSSGLHDVHVNDMMIIQGGGDRYLEVRAAHPDLWDGE